MHAWPRATSPSLRALPAVVAVAAAAALSTHACPPQPDNLHALCGRCNQTALMTPQCLQQGLHARDTVTHACATRHAGANVALAATSARSSCHHSHTHCANRKQRRGAGTCVGASCPPLSHLLCSASQCTAVPMLLPSTHQLACQQQKHRQRTACVLQGTSCDKSAAGPGIQRAQLASRPAGPSGRQQP